MLRILVLLAMLITALPAGAQTAAQRDAVPGVTLTLPAVPRITAGHAAALATGMFAGAVAGTVMINGGAIAAVIGTIAGGVLGNWYWNEYGEPQD